jgi:hypothetical protein
MVQQSKRSSLTANSTGADVISCKVPKRPASCPIWASSSTHAVHRSDTSAATRRAPNRTHGRRKKSWIYAPSNERDERLAHRRLQRLRVPPAAARDRGRGRRRRLGEHAREADAPAGGAEAPERVVRLGVVERGARAGRTAFFSAAGARECAAVVRDDVHADVREARQVPFRLVLIIIVRRDDADGGARAGLARGREELVGGDDGRKRRCARARAAPAERGGEPRTHVGDVVREAADVDGGDRRAGERVERARERRVLRAAVVERAAAAAVDEREVRLDAEAGERREARVGGRAARAGRRRRRRRGRRGSRGGGRQRERRAERDGVQRRARGERRVREDARGVRLRVVRARVRARAELERVQRRVERCGAPGAVAEVRVAQREGVQVREREEGREARGGRALGGRRRG